MKIKKFKEEKNKKKIFKKKKKKKNQVKIITKFKTPFQTKLKQQQNLS